MKSAYSFFDFCILCEKEAEADGRNGAAVNYRKIRLKVDSFLSGKSLRLSDIDEKWVKSFNDWLISQNHEKTTISFYNRSLRSIYNQAAKKRLVRNTHPFDEAYTKVFVTHYPVNVEAEEGEKVPLEELSHEELLKQYKNLAYKYNDILYKLRGIMAV